MPLTRVTITGADDDVDPQALFDTSEAFPFVEWGILHSASQSGKPRFPSERWLEQLRDERLAQHGRRKIALSAHLCGKLARKTLEGDDRAFVGVAWPYERIQINGFNAESPPTIDFIDMLKTYPGLEFILQLRSLTEWELARAIAEQTTNVVGLFDASGGLGVRPKEWPAVPSSQFRCGFAGGITPENVIEVLDSLSGREHDYWIDLETGVRNKDQLDLGRIQTVLTKAFDYVDVK